MKRARGGDRGAGAEVDSHGDRSSIDDWFANQEKNAKARPLITLREKPKKKRKRDGGCDICGKVSCATGAGGMGAGPGKNGHPGYSFNWCGPKHHKQMQPQIDAVLAAYEPTPRAKAAGTISAKGPITWKRMKLSEYERGRAGDLRIRDRVDSHGSKSTPASKGPNRTEVLRRARALRHEGRAGEPQRRLRAGLRGRSARGAPATGTADRRGAHVGRVLELGDACRQFSRGLVVNRAERERKKAIVAKALDRRQAVTTLRHNYRPYVESVTIDGSRIVMLAKEGAHDIVASLLPPDRKLWGCSIELRMSPRESTISMQGLGDGDEGSS